MCAVVGVLWCLAVLVVLVVVVVVVKCGMWNVECDGGVVRRGIVSVVSVPHNWDLRAAFYLVEQGIL